MVTLSEPPGGLTRSEVYGAGQLVLLPAGLSSAAMIA